MAKKTKTFRLEQTEIEFLNHYGKNLTENMHNALQRLQYLENRPAPTTQPEQSTESIPGCRHRIEFNNKNWCVQTTPKGLNRLKEIPVLEICRICKLEKVNVPESAEIKQKQQIATEVRDHTRTGFSEAGMKYCNFAGIWVYRTKCQLCKTKNYAQYSECQTKKVEGDA